MKTGKTYRGMKPVGKREKQRKQIRGEKEVVLAERGNGVG
jgi:hypothetical protein